MKNRILGILCFIFIFVQEGLCVDKIGVVDIQCVVNSSSAVRALKQEHSLQIQSLNAIVTEAQNAISQETDPQKIVLLQDKYNAQFNQKKEMIDSQYQTKLSCIEASIKQDIINSAKKHNYDFVIAKSVVFYGGDDITDLVIRDLK